LICDFHNPDLWPSTAHRLILKAALHDGEPAIDAWRRWQSGNSLESADSASFQLLPKLYLNLRRLLPAAPELETLRGIYKYTWCCNQLALRSLVEVLRVLERADIRTAVLKGLPLILDHYTDVGARMMADNDLLIDEQDLSRADAALREAGWEPNLPLPPRPLVPYLAECHYARPHWTDVDLHWRPLSIDCPPEAEHDFRARLVPRDLQGVKTCVPDHTDHLLLTCIHGRKQDDHARARWVLDAMTLFATADPPIDWDVLLDRARQVGLVMPVCDSLAYLQTEFDAPVPSEVLGRAAKHSALPDDLRRYRELVRGSLAGCSVVEEFTVHWWRFSRVCQVRGRKSNLGQFPRYYLAFKQWEWQLPSRWRVLPKAAMVVTRRLLGLTRTPQAD
jgi:hypothetical protein